MQEKSEDVWTDNLPNKTKTDNKYIKRYSNS